MRAYRTVGSPETAAERAFWYARTLSPEPRGPGGGMLGALLSATLAAFALYVLAVAP